MSPTCPACHREVNPRSRFCPFCGTPLARRITTGAALDGGNYVIVRSLSKGGMGAVYLANDRRAFDRLCVVKQMLEYYDTADPTERERAQRRFEEEGRTLATLSHPGVPRIFAFFIESGRYYIVMEYIKGANLESFLTHEDDSGQLVAPAKRLPREEVIRYTIQLCRILEYLHALPHPVIHQDIKPANIILEAHLGEVRLVDFGTARQEIPAGTVMNQANASIYGTAGYAPPEQYQGHPVPRSDVYALAASVYHLLTDDDPRAHPFHFPKLNTLPKEIGIALEQALRLEPNQRSRANELRQALESLTAPKRILETFTFPGGVQIRSVGALPALCDEHWDAARSFLYNGDFQRWLRDLNRHDLVIAANEIVKANTNHDAALEQFLRVVDQGIALPKVIVDQPQVNFGSVAREAAISRNLVLVNETRGYTQVHLSADQPWLEPYPTTIHLWAHIPVKLRVSVHAQNLPLRTKQSAVLTIDAPDQPPVKLQVFVQVSIVRELWRILHRALAAAIPELFRQARAAWRWHNKATRTLTRPFRRWPWLTWLLWLVMGAGIGAGLYYLPAGYSLTFRGYTLAHPTDWQGYVWPVILGPPLILLSLWLVTFLAMVLGGAIWGTLRGLWKSFTR